jgi:hypothetical protein
MSATPSGRTTTSTGPQRSIPVRVAFYSRTNQRYPPEGTRTARQHDLWRAAAERYGVITSVYYDVSDPTGLSHSDLPTRCAPPLGLHASSVQTWQPAGTNCRISGYDRSATPVATTAGRAQGSPA